MGCSSVKAVLLDFYLYKHFLVFVVFIQVTLIYSFCYITVAFIIYYLSFIYQRLCFW